MPRYYKNLPIEETYTGTVNIEDINTDDMKCNTLTTNTETVNNFLTITNNNASYNKQNNSLTISNASAFINEINTTLVRVLDCNLISRGICFYNSLDNYVYFNRITMDSDYNFYFYTRYNNLSSIFASTLAATLTTGSLLTRGGLRVYKNLILGTDGALTISELGLISISNTASNSINTLGGIIASKNITTNGILTINGISLNSTTDIYKIHQDTTDNTTISYLNIPAGLILNSTSLTGQQNNGIIFQCDDNYTSYIGPSCDRSLTTNNGDLHYSSHTGNHYFDAAPRSTTSAELSTGTVYMNSITNSTNSTTGALVISGGVGISKDIFTTGNINLSSTNLTSNSINLYYSNNSISINANSTGLNINNIINSTGLNVTGNTTLTTGTISTTPTNTTDITNKLYVDTAISAAVGGSITHSTNLINTGSLTTDTISTTSGTINDLTSSSIGTSITNKNYVQQAITDAISSGTITHSNALTNTGLLTTDSLTINGATILSTTPTTNDSITNKLYVDNSINSIKTNSTISTSTNLVNTGTLTSSSNITTNGALNCNSFNTSSLNVFSFSTDNKTYIQSQYTKTAKSYSDIVFTAIQTSWLDATRNNYPGYRFGNDTFELTRPINILDTSTTSFNTAGGISITGRSIFKGDLTINNDSTTNSRSVNFCYGSTPNTNKSRIYANNDGFINMDNGLIVAGGINSTNVTTNSVTTEILTMSNTTTGQGNAIISYGTDSSLRGNYRLSISFNGVAYYLYHSEGTSNAYTIEIDSGTYSTTIIHTAPTNENLEPGTPVFMSGDIYTTKYENMIEYFTKFNNGNNDDCISSIKSNGDYKTFVGIVVDMSTKQENNTYKIRNNKKYYYVNTKCATFATHGDYIFKVDDNTKYKVGDDLLYDGSIIDDNTPITNKINNMKIGKITHIFTEGEKDNYINYVSVFKN